jgi:hypothetical protein
VVVEGCGHVGGANGRVNYAIAIPQRRLRAVWRTFVAWGRIGGISGRLYDERVPDNTARKMYCGMSSFRKPREVQAHASGLCPFEKGAERKNMIKEIGSLFGEALASRVSRFKMHRVGILVSRSRSR